MHLLIFFGSTGLSHTQASMTHLFPYPNLFRRAPLAVLGVISDAQVSQLQAIAELWPQTPHQICQFHAIKEAGRLIYVLDHRIKTDMRIRMQEKTHEYRQDIHRRLPTANQELSP